MKKILAIVAAFAVVGFNGFMLMEGAVSQAQESDSWNVTLSVTSELALTCDDDGGDLALTPAIAGMTGGSATAVTSCNVETSNDSGWNLAIKDDNGDDGYMIDGGNDIDAYPTSTPATWVLDSQSAAYYGYYASSSYNTGGHGSLLYRDLTNSDVNIATDAGETAVGGIEVAIGFRAEIGNAVNQPSGDYVSNVTVTATELP